MKPIIQNATASVEAYSPEKVDEVIQKLKDNSTMYKIYTNPDRKKSKIDSEYCDFLGYSRDCEHSLVMSLFGTYIEQIILKQGIDFNGHRNSRSEEIKRKLEDEDGPFMLGHEVKYQFDEPGYGEFMTEALFRDILLGKKEIITQDDCLSECYECGGYVQFKLCGKELTVPSQCTPVGYYNTEVEFPTGQVIMADCINEIHEDIQRLFARKDESYSMRSAGSHRDISAMYARAGMYHVYVGNSCPSVYFDGESELITIGNSGFDEDTDEIVNELPGEKIESVCTDLWWVSIIDIKNFKKLLKRVYGGRKGARLYNQALVSGKWTYDIVDIPAGKYLGTSYFHKDHYPKKWNDLCRMATLQYKGE